MLILVNIFVCSILKDPSNDKFKVLKRTNKVIAAKLMSLKPQEKVLELIGHLGYTEIDADLSSFVGENYKGLMSGNKLIEITIEDIKMLSMSEYDRNKILTIRKEKAEFYAKKAEEDKRKRELLEIAEKRKADKQGEVHTEAAKGTTLNFGAHLVKFEPPKNQGG